MKHSQSNFGSKRPRDFSSDIDSNYGEKKKKTVSQSKKEIMINPMLNKKNEGALSEPIKSITLPNNSQSFRVKVNKTEIQSARFNPLNISKSKPSKNIDFREGCLDFSTNSNLRAVVEQAKKLEIQNKKLMVETEDSSLRLMNEHIRKNLLLLELEGLTKQLDEYKILNEKKQINRNENVSKLTAMRESMMFNLDKSKICIDDINTKKLHLKSKIIVKNDEIAKENITVIYIFLLILKHIELVEREKEIDGNKRNLTFDTLKVEEETKMYYSIYYYFRIERRLRLQYIEFDKLNTQKEEYFKNKLDTISQIIVLKPFYKKFFILRNIQNKEIEKNDLLKNIQINKNRKNIIYSNEKNEDLTLEFNYAISLHNNCFEEIKYAKEDSILNNELLSMFMSYMIQMTSANDERNLVSLYLSQNLNMDYPNLNFNCNMLNSLIEVAKHISHFNEILFNFKLIFRENILDILSKDYVFKDCSSNKQNFSLILFQDLILKNETAIANKDNLIGVEFILTNTKNNSKMKIFYLNIQETTIINSLLTNFNNFNTKKKREKSSKNKKSNKDVQFILDEMNVIEAFYFITLLDLNCDENINLKNLRELMINLQ